MQAILLVARHATTIFLWLFGEERVRNKYFFLPLHVHALAEVA